MSYKSIKYILPVVVMAMLLGCDRKIVIDDDNVRYEFLQECLWRHTTYSDEQTSLPALALDPESHIYFTNKEMVILEEQEDEKYKETARYVYRIDRGNDIITLDSAEESYFFSFHIINETHMTMFYKGLESEYVVYARSPLPDEDDIITEE